MNCGNFTTTVTPKDRDNGSTRCPRCGKVIKINTRNDEAFIASHHPSENESKIDYKGIMEMSDEKPAKVNHAPDISHIIIQDKQN